MQKTKVMIIMKKSAGTAAIFTLLLLFGWGCNNHLDTPDDITPVTHLDSVGYIIGYDYGKGIRDQQIDANPLMIYKGLYDALNHHDYYFSDSTKARLVRSFQREVDSMEQIRFRKMVAQNKEAGSVFMEKNKKAEGVKVLPSGLQYKILKPGVGKQYPALTDSVTIHYRAMYTDRTTFDMSYETGPISIRINHLVKGLQEGIQLMHPGAIFEFYIPSQLGYGDQNYLDMIPGGSTIIYNVELIIIH
jgi:FKBP-type peptidyl-prolyl cis-trans isomerase FklB